MEDFKYNMSDKEAIGVIMDDLLTILENMIDDKSITILEKDSLIFGIKVLKFCAIYRKNCGAVTHGWRRSWNQKAVTKTSSRENLQFVNRKFPEI